MKLFSISGGSTKGIGAVGIYEYLYYSGYRPDIIGGVSIGSLLSVPLAMGKFDEIKSLFFDRNLFNKMWKHAPVKKNGKFSIKAIYVLLRHKLAIGDMSNIKNELKKIISQEDFKEYQKGNYPICLSLSIDFKTGERRLINFKDTTYEEFINHTFASASIPIFNMPVKIGNDILYDGGVRDHIATHKIMQEYPVTESISVFTRPKDYKLTNLNWEPKNIIDVLLRNTEIRNIEISKNDEKNIKEIIKDKGLNPHKNKILFLPSILEGLYDVDNIRLRMLYREGLKLGNKVYE